jgi:hypothetical protein
MKTKIKPGLRSMKLKTNKKKTIQRIKETKNWFFEMISKSNKPLGNLTRQRDLKKTMLVAALFTIATLWKQSRCPTTYEYPFKKMWYIYTM